MKENFKTMPAWSNFPGRMSALPSTNAVVRKLVEMISPLYLAAVQDKMVKKVCKNLSIVSQLKENDPRIVRWIRALCENLLSSYLDFICAFSMSTKQPEAYFEIDQEGLDEIRQFLSGGQGIVLAGCHTYSFDLAICCLDHLFPEVQILTKANPTGGSLLMYYLRRLKNLAVTPISVPALRKAITSLNAGGVVAIAIDLHLPGEKEYHFFGHKCHLTDAHTRMAVKTGAEVFLCYTTRSNTGKVRIRFQHVEPPKKWRAKTDLIESWAQKSFQQLEPFIRNWPEAWYGLTFDLFSRPIPKVVPAGKLVDREILLSRGHADLPGSSI